MSSIQAEIPCPECGDLFGRRGMATQRRMKHGVLARRATDYPTPPPPLPSGSLDQPQGAPPNPMMGDLMGLVQRLEQRVEALERHVDTSGAFTAQSEHLRLELDRVMLELAALSVQPEGRSESNDELVVRHRALGQLRRKQAELLYHLDPTGNGDFVDDAL